MSGDGQTKEEVSAMPKKQLSNLMTPSLLIDLERLKNNIKKMAAKTESNGVNLHPHIKTHKCIEIGKLQLEHGASGITVSTLDEATIFADAGFHDITYAVPISSNKIKAALEIASEINLRLLVDSHEMVSHLETNSKKNGMSPEVLLKVHCGYHRTGVNPRDPASIKLASKIERSSNLDFKGILTHAGHSYDAMSVKQIKEAAIQEQLEMVTFAKSLETKPEVVSIGSTPTISLTDSIMEGITEVRPGNYVFYDFTQVALGTCQVSDCVLTVVSRVIGKYDEYLVIDAGATALSKDLGPTHLESETSFGKIYSNYDNHELDTFLQISSLSQEHGKVKFFDSATAQGHKVDEILRILPNHSCLTANLHDCYNVVRDNEIIDQWKIRRERPITSPC